MIHEHGDAFSHVRRTSHNSTLCGRLPLIDEDWRGGSDFLPICYGCHEEMMHLKQGDLRS